MGILFVFTLLAVVSYKHLCVSVWMCVSKGRDCCITWEFCFDWGRAKLFSIETVSFYFIQAAYKASDLSIPFQCVFSFLMGSLPIYMWCGISWFWFLTSLETDNIECIFMYLLAICISSLKKCPFKVFAPKLFSLILNHKSSLYILYTMFSPKCTSK